MLPGSLQCRICVPEIDATLRRAAFAGTDDEFRIGLEHGLDADHRCGRFQICKDVDGAAGVQGVRDDVGTVQGIERAVPDLVEHPHWRISASTHGQAGKSRAQPRRYRTGDDIGAHQRAQALEAAGDVIQRARLTEKKRNTQPAQLRHLGWRAALFPHHDQIGLQSDEALDIELVGIADTGDGKCLLRVIAIIDGAHDPGAAAGRKQQFGQMGGHRNDTHRRMGQAQQIAVIIPDAAGRGSVSRCQHCATHQRACNGLHRRPRAPSIPREKATAHALATAGKKIVRPRNASISIGCPRQAPSRAGCITSAMVPAATVPSGIKSKAWVATACARFRS